MCNKKADESGRMKNLHSGLVNSENEVDRECHFVNPMNLPFMKLNQTTIGVRGHEFTTKTN